VKPRVTNIYTQNFVAFKAGQRLIINQGGQGSSKTWSILQLFYALAKYRFPEKNLKFTICSNSMPHLKLGVLDYFNKILLEFDEIPDAIHHKTDHYFKVGNSIIEYFGIRDSPEKTLGPRRDFLFINEANNKITYEDFDQLNQRTHVCTSVDFNPRSRFWIHDKVMPHFKHKLIKSTYEDNPWLPKNEEANILWKKDKKEFAAWWKVYGLGELGSFEGVVFPNWETGEYPEDVHSMYCLDFGFHPSPDAMVKEYIDQKRRIIYLDEQFYNYNQKPEDLKKAIGECVKNNEEIIADSADNRMIAYLQSSFRISPVSKTGLVTEWIRLMQDYKIIVTPGSKNLINELNNYVYLDQKEGVPAKGNDHLIDPARYGFMRTFTGRVPTKAY